MAAKAVGWGMIGTRGWSDIFLGPAVNAARGARFKAVLSTRQTNAERYCASHGVARGYADLEGLPRRRRGRRGVDREPQSPAQGPDRRRAQGGQACALREAHGDEPGRVPGDDQGRQEGRPPAHHWLQQPPPSKARYAPRAVAVGPLRPAGAHALPVPLPLSRRTRRLVAPGRREVRLLGAGRYRHPLHRPAALVQRRGEDGARAPLQQGLRALRRHCRRPPSASRTVPWERSRHRPR